MTRQRMIGAELVLQRTVVGADTGNNQRGNICERSMRRQSRLLTRQFNNNTFSVQKTRCRRNQLPVSVHCVEVDGLLPLGVYSVDRRSLNSLCCTFLPCDALRCTVFVIVILSVRPSVCLSVCHTRGLCPHGSTYDHDFFTVW